MFSDPMECYQAIGNSLSNSAKESWDRIVLDATLDDTRVDVVVGCWRDGAETPVEYLTGVPRLASFIYDLARLVSTKEKGLFKKCSFILHKNGKFNVDFAY
jgi:hypothetical protein